jgi:hypothetical protein
MLHKIQFSTTNRTLYKDHVDLINRYSKKEKKQDNFFANLYSFP